MIKKYFEEIIIVVFLVGSLTVSFSPFVYEILKAGTTAVSDRYPIFETEYPPDMRVYFSRMQEGIDGKWLVSEKFTSEPHRPTLFHEPYLLMGKITGWFGLEPDRAFPFWRLVCGAFMLISGYFFIATQLKERKTRIGAFILFVMAGNLPIFVKNGIPLLGMFFSYHLDWLTFMDPVKRLIFLPHYTLSSALTILTLMFISRGTFKDYFIGGFLALLAVIVLPSSFPIIVGTVVIYSLFSFREGFKKLLSKQLVFGLWSVLMLVFIIISVSYFPWNTQPVNDKNISIPFNWIEYLSALGITGWIGLIGSFYILIFRKKEGYLSAIWVLMTLAEIGFLGFLPVMNRYRLTQIDFHLPLAVTSVIFGWSFISKLKRKTLVLSIFLIFLLIPSFITWPMSLRSQITFVNDKLKATYPLIPAAPYVVYPVRDFMESLLWLKANTSHDSIIMAGETAGSMIPAYSGNTVYLGHGHQTVNFPQKQLLMQSFYRQENGENIAADFLKTNGVTYVFFGPEEAQLSNKNNLNYSFLKLIFQNNLVKIFQFNANYK